MGRSFHLVNKNNILDDIMTVKNLALLLLVPGLLLISTVTAGAEKIVAVGILPMTILSDQPDPQLGRRISLMMAKQLEEEGIKPIFLEEAAGTEQWGIDQFKETGIRSGADFIITGTAFIAGNGISIDAKMVPVYLDMPVHTFFSETKSFEQLLSAVHDLSRQTVSVIFQKKLITRILVAGNQRVEADAIKNVIETKPGDIYKQKNLTEDLARIHKMGWFESVTVKKESLDTGLEITFDVVEKPSVRKVKFTKNHVFDTEDFTEIISTKTGSILNIFKINEDMSRMKRLYTEKNYHNCRISYEIVELENNQADVVYTFDEGEKLRIQNIRFSGNDSFDAEDLKDEMESSEKGLFYWITSSGDLDEIELKNDSVRVESFYKNNGYADAKVSDPEIVFQEKGIDVSYKIQEGEQYTIGRTEIDGDLIVEKETLLEKIQTREKEIYNREVIRKDVIQISDIYSNKGFANAEVRPLISRNDDHTIDVTFSIAKGSPVYIERVIISGNLKTRDKVIRREIRAQEQSLFSKENIQRSFKNLSRLDYFEQVKIEPVKTVEPDRMNLNVEVVEKNTGSFSFGGGYSGEDGFFVAATIQENNLFGRGQSANAKVQFGEESNRFNVGFTEPWLFDIPLTVGFDVYKWDAEYDYYDKDSIGLQLRGGYKIFDYTTVGLILRWEQFEIENNQPEYTNVTPGEFFSGSISPYIKYDSRDRMFVPTEGSLHRFSIEYAGEFLGGEIDYIKYIAETTWYIPLFWKLTGVVHAEGGILDDMTDNKIDIDYERFYLGGMNSIRGFDKTNIDATYEGETIQRGGEKYVQFNVEITFPLYEPQNLTGVVFYDRGDVYRDDEDITLGDQFSSYGLGIRWNSPLGPLRIEYGIVLEGKDKREKGDGQWEFSVGAFF